MAVNGCKMVSVLDGYLINCIKMRSSNPFNGCYRSLWQPVASRKPVFTTKDVAVGATGVVLAKTAALVAINGSYNGSLSKVQWER